MGHKPKMWTLKGPDSAGLGYGLCGVGTLDWVCSWVKLEHGLLGLLLGSALRGIMDPAKILVLGTTKEWTCIGLTQGWSNALIEITAILEVLNRRAWYAFTSRNQPGNCWVRPTFKVFNNLPWKIAGSQIRLANKNELTRPGKSGFTNWVGMFYGQDKVSKFGFREVSSPVKLQSSGLNCMVKHS